MGCSASYLSSWARKIGLNHWSLSFILLSAIFSPLTSWAHCLLHSLNSSGTDCSLASSTTNPLPYSAPEAKEAKLPWESDTHSASSSLPCPSFMWPKMSESQSLLHIFASMAHSEASSDFLCAANRCQETFAFSSLTFLWKAFCYHLASLLIPFPYFLIEGWVQCDVNLWEGPVGCDILQR
jgi:hypothetical protein